MISVLVLLSVASPVAANLTVYTFDSKPDDPLATATLTNGPQLPSLFILCVSFKLDMLDGRGFFHLLGQDTSPWLTLTLDKEAGTGAVHLWALLGDQGISHRFGHVRQPKLKVWYHVCAAVDTLNGTLDATLNGELFQSRAILAKEDIVNKPTTLQSKLTLGYFVSTWGKNDPQQFHGSVSNVRVYSWRFIDQLKNLSSRPCDFEDGDYMSWQQMTWSISGPGVMKGSSSWSVCHEHQTTETQLALPFGMTQPEALSVCQILGNGTMFSTFNQTKLEFFLNRFNQTTSGVCTYIWTPYSDEQEEGTFVDLLDGSLAESIAWLDGQPNEGRLANGLVINTYRQSTPFGDASNKYKGACTSCLVKLALVFRMWGLCEVTFMGEMKIVVFY